VFIHTIYGESSNPKCIKEIRDDRPTLLGAFRLIGHTNYVIGRPHGNNAWLDVLSHKL
jgi:hypothetical protein